MRTSLGGTAQAVYLAFFSSWLLLCSTVVALPEPVTASYLSSSATCAALSLALGKKVSYPNSNVFKSSLTSYWSMLETSLVPDCIVTPANTKDVSTAVKILTTLGAVLGEKFAIRGGGHTPYAGSANINNGITIDLRDISSVVVDKKRSVVAVGGGAIWGDVYRKADAAGLAVVGSRGASIGVGGLTTGGGISHFSARKGFACDNVVAYEVVTASGAIVTASATQNKDLWLALRGGSSNFGIVTRFDLAAFPSGNFWGGTILYDGSAVPALLKGLADLNKPTGFDEYAALILSVSYVPALGAFLGVANIEYTKAVSNPATFKQFTAAGPQLANSMRISNLTAFTEEFVASQPNGRRQLYITNTFQSSLPLLTAVNKIFTTLAPSLSGIPTLEASLTLQPMPPAITSKAASRGGNVLGLGGSASSYPTTPQTSLVLCLISFTWDDAAHDKQIEQLGKEIDAQIVREAKKRNMWHPWVYLNYAAKWQNPIAGYGQENVKKLRDASRKWDPRGVFQKQVPGGFKLY